MNKNLEQVLTTIKENDHFLVTSHINPDGDAIGAMAAMGYICLLYTSPSPRD